MMINEEKMDKILLELGHDDYNRGTAYIRQALRCYDCGGRMMTKEIYPAVARAYGSTSSRVERCMRHSIEKAWGRGSIDAQRRFFGYSIDPNKGTPTVGEYVARLARVCFED